MTGTEELEGAAYRRRRIGAQDGLRLSVRDYGDPLADGCPLLCLSGLSRNAKDFHDLAARLAAKRRVVALDYRGRGRSDYDPEPRNYRPEVYISDIQQLLAALNLHGVVVCGTSLGGLLAMGLAVAVPAVLAGVILNDVGPDVDPEAGRRIVRLLKALPPQPDWPAAEAYLRKAMPHLGFSQAAQWRRFATATYRAAEDGTLVPDWDPAVIRAVERSGGKLPDLWPLFRALRGLPVLAIRGADSDVLSEVTFRRMAEEKPDMLCVTVPGVGHAPALDEPIAEQAIDDFLDRLDRHHR